MSLLVVGLSYRTSPLELLERAALSAQDCRQVERDLCRGAHVAEAVVLSTCNRLEVYAQVSKFHGGVAEVSRRLSDATGVDLETLTEHLYVHYDDAAVAHVFGVACGLDSMAVGEQQIIGQVRMAMRAARDEGSVGRTLTSVLQQALRVGKRAHSETGLDQAGKSLVEAGLDRARELLGDLSGASALVIGAGAMSGLAVATVARAGVARVLVANRTPERAERLAQSVSGRAISLEELPTALQDADVVISCTGAVGYVVGTELAVRGREGRGDRSQVYVDLALPRDVDPDVADLSGVEVVDLEALGRRLAVASVSADLAQVRALVAQEVSGYLAGQRAEAVAPTVVALRAQARSVVDAELTRLAGRLGTVDDRIRSEVEQTVHRVVEKLLYLPTVKVKELAGEPGGSTYAEALRELFGLNLDAVSAVSQVPALGGPGAVAPTGELSGAGGAA